MESENNLMQDPMLPPGVSDRMIDEHTDGPPCNNCGHTGDWHYDEGDEVRDDSNQILEACNHVGCECKKYEY